MVTAPWHMGDRVLPTHNTARLCLTVGLAVCLSLAHGMASGSDGETAPARLRVQESLDLIKSKLGVPHEVIAQLVDQHPLVVAVAPLPGRESFRMSLEAAFVDELSDEELDAVMAHELGHVWIFTHHPFLQTEQLANQIAMRVVSRQTLEAVYAKVSARGGHTDRLLRFTKSRAN